MAPRRKNDEQPQGAQPEQTDPPEQAPSEAPPQPVQNPNVPVNPPEPADPLADPEQQVGAVNPPDAETDQQGVDNRTRDDQQVPVNPLEPESDHRTRDDEQVPDNPDQTRRVPDEDREG